MLAVIALLIAAGAYAAYTVYHRFVVEELPFPGARRGPATTWSRSTLGRPRTRPPLPCRGEGNSLGASQKWARFEILSIFFASGAEFTCIRRAVRFGFTPATPKTSKPRARFSGGFAKPFSRPLSAHFREATDVAPG